MATAEVAAQTRTFANICLDVQIAICMFLHPSDILALRKTCKALQPSTRQRVVWVAALHKVCFDNALFLPSFPISDMSDLELEKAAMGPRRWIELCGAFGKQHPNDPVAILRPRAARNINNSFPTKVDYRTEIFIVPGGRYLVGYSPDTISVWDLGYTSSADCKLIASVQPGSEICLVQATPDGMGLIIFSSNARDCSIYEIYPQSETPHLTQIAHLQVGPDFRLDEHSYLLPETVILWCIYEHKIVFRVWDYRLNHSTSFSLDADIGCFQVMATKTAVIILREFPEQAILIWAIPPLSPGLIDFFDHNPAHLPPLFTLPFPEHVPGRLEWKTISSWYFGSSYPFYFDMLCRDFKLHRFQIMLKPDLSTASLHVISASEVTPYDFDCESFEENYRICEDTLVTSWINHDNGQDQYQCGVYMGLTSARFANAIPRSGFSAKMSIPNIRQNCCLSLCPASGRFVFLDIFANLSVLDIF